ncbi:MAG TPA: glycosyltransferase family 2 protein [Candidatus Bathyarchaeia archaeon]|nr:glycosyltransferase family 2 protein [Candidatus Bathyarchaeia archaeon]
MKTNTPTISIITVTKNAGHILAKTIDSVVAQTYPHIEYIIIDALSDDNTLTIANEYRERISHIISEPDSGIYDAMNKGIALATGDILCFLNAGDRLYENQTIEKIAGAFNRTHAWIVYGKPVYENIPPGLEKRYTQRSYIFDSKMAVAEYNSPQQCFFYQRGAFDQIGLFDTRFKVAADMDWFLRSLNLKIPNYFLDEFVCVCDLGGISSFPHVKERIAVFRKNMNMTEFLHYSLFAITRQCQRLLNKERLN